MTPEAVVHQYAAASIIEAQDAGAGWRAGQAPNESLHSSDRGYFDILNAGAPDVIDTYRARHRCMLSKHTVRGFTTSLLCRASSLLVIIENACKTMSHITSSIMRKGWGRTSRVGTCTRGKGTATVILSSKHRARKKQKLKQDAFAVLSTNFRLRDCLG